MSIKKYCKNKPNKKPNLLICALLLSGVFFFVDERVGERLLREAIMSSPPDSTSVGVTVSLSQNCTSLSSPSQSSPGSKGGELARSRYDSDSSEARRKLRLLDLAASS